MKFKIENLCGYTANKPPMQAGKIKKALNGKRVKFIFVGGAIPEAGNKAEWIVNAIYGENCYPKSRIKSGKTEYWFIIPNINRGYQVNKTEYDFAIWLTENFKTLSEVLKADTDETARLKRIEIAKIEQEQAELQAEAKRQEEKLQFEEYALSEAEKLLDTNVCKVFEQIYTKKFGAEWLNSGRAYRSLMLYVCAKEIENPLAKDMLIHWLYNHNKCSIKFFETITGVKMPQAYGKRVELINSLTADKINLMQP